MSSSFTSRLCLFFSAFWIEILCEFIRGDRAWNSIGRDFGFGSPKDCVQDDFAEIIVSPIFVEMCAGEAEAATAIGTFTSPCDVLKFAAFDGFANVGIAFVRTVGAAHSAFRRDGRENRGNAFHAITE